jgi:hypothetical protein
MCDECKSYLVKDNQIQTHQKSITPEIQITDYFDRRTTPILKNESQDSTNKNSNTKEETIEVKYETKIEEQKPVELSLESKQKDSIEILLKNNQLNKHDIDKLVEESYKFQNNIKLYLMDNLLNDDSNEILKSTFNFRLFFSNEPKLTLNDCFCVLTSKRINVFSIKDRVL